MAPGAPLPEKKPKEDKVECIWQTPDTQLIFSHTEGEKAVHPYIKMMMQGTSKRWRVEVVAAHLQVVRFSYCPPAGSKRFILRNSGSLLLPSLMMYMLQEHHNHGFE